MIATDSLWSQATPSWRAVEKSCCFDAFRKRRPLRGLLPCRSSRIAFGSRQTSAAL